MTDRGPADPLAPERPYRRLSPLTPLARGGIIVAAATTTVFRDVARGDLGPTALVLLALLVAGGVFGVASWVRTKFWIEADELRVDTGVISRQSRRIRIDRLQGIDIVQPFVARLLGLAELRMDVAGGSNREGSLAFLALAEARELKDVLLARRDAVRGTTGEPAAEGSPAGPADETAAAAPVPGPVPEQLIARVDLRMLLLSLLLSMETVALVLTGLGVLVVLFAGNQWVGLGAVLPILAGTALVLFKRFSGNYRFTVTQTPAGLQVRRGLFELSAQTIALSRLQGVVVSEPLLWRRLGWARLDVSIAGYGTTGENEGPAPSTVLPVGDRATVRYLTQHVLGGIDPDAVPLHPAPRRARWAAPVGWRFMAAGLGESLVVSREGWFVRRTHAAPHARVQSLRLSQGPWQRRLGLADVHVDSPPGPTSVRARHRQEGEARAFLETERSASRAARQAPG